MVTAGAVTNESGDRRHIGDAVIGNVVAEWRPESKIKWGDAKRRNLGDLLNDGVFSMIGYFIEKNHKNIEKVTLRTPVVCYIAGKSYKKVTINGYDYIQKKSAIKRIRIRK